MKNMKNKIEITEAQLLLNNEIMVTDSRSQFLGQTGIVNSIMADGRTLEVDFGKSKVAFVDVTMVTDTALRESYNWPKQEQSLGPDANSVLPHNRL
jgi:hypothetical protein